MPAVGMVAYSGAAFGTLLIVPLAGFAVLGFLGILLSYLQSIIPEQISNIVLSVPWLLTASAFLAWKGIVPLMVMAFFLCRFRFAGRISFALVGGLIGAFVALVMYSTDPRLSGLYWSAGIEVFVASLAGSGAVYAIVYRSLLKMFARPVPPVTRG